MSLNDRRDANGEIADDFREPPDLAIEILSPRQSATKLIERCLWYVAHGVTIALFVDPVERLVLRFRPNAVPVSLTASDRIDLDDVLPGFTLTVKELFDSLKVTGGDVPLERLLRVPVLRMRARI